MATITKPKKISLIIPEKTKFHISNIALLNEVNFENSNITKVTFILFHSFSIDLFYIAF